MKQVIKKLDSILGTNESEQEEQNFLQHEWTKEQQEEFETYLFNRLLNEKELRNEFLRHDTKKKKILMQAVAQFSWSYGPKDMA